MLLSWIHRGGGCQEWGSFSFSSSPTAWAFPKTGTSISAIGLPSWAKPVKLDVQHGVVFGLCLFVWLPFCCCCTAKENDWFSTGWLQQRQFSSAQSVLWRSLKAPDIWYKQGRRKTFEEDSRPNITFTVWTGTKGVLNHSSPDVTNISFLWCEVSIFSNWT